VKPCHQSGTGHTKSCVSFLEFKTIIVIIILVIIREVNEEDDMSVWG